MRKIIHIDMDCFFAAVEMRDDPSLQGLPIAVGGDAGRRGVLCTCNYEARRFGVRSAMPSFMAMQKCPELKIIKPHFHKYKEASDIIRGVFQEYTDLIEPLSLDEAYLDVSNSYFCHGSATWMAAEIKEKIYDRTRLTASAGVAPNKFLAKVASDWNKPNGLTVVTPEDVDSFVANLPVRKIPGVGKVTEEKLHSLGISSCRDIRERGEDFLSRHFKSSAHSLYQRAHGIDHSEVEVEYDRKSLSTEETFVTDLPSLQECKSEMGSIVNEFLRRLKKWKEREEEDKGIVTLFVKMKFNDFNSVTVEKTRPFSFFDPLIKSFSFSDGLQELLDELMETAWKRGERPVRLLGLGVKLKPIDFIQGELFS